MVSFLTLHTDTFYSCFVLAVVGSYIYNDMYDQRDGCKEMKYGGSESKVEIHG